MKRSKVSTMLTFFVSIAMIIASISLFTGCPFDDNPEPPAGVEITLEWDANAPGDQVIGYRIHYGIESRQYIVHQEVYLGSTYCTITNLVPDVTYYFAVTAYNAYGESNYSNEVSWTFTDN